ncbi:hypothetical protein D1007_62112 [Hordeum vulgare]|nr:hypothetical protein D1007_62112 [Hordeum vulgare]
MARVSAATPRFVGICHIRTPPARRNLHACRWRAGRRCWSASTAWGCARWAWKRCVHTGYHDSATWGHTAAADFALVHRMCSLVMANYEPDLAAPLLDPSNVVCHRTYADAGGRVTPSLLYLDLGRSVASTSAASPTTRCSSTTASASAASTTATSTMASSGPPTSRKGEPNPLPPRLKGAARQDCQNTIGEQRVAISETCTQDARENPQMPGNHLQLLHTQKAPKFPRRRVQGGHDATDVVAAHPQDSRFRPGNVVGVWRRATDYDSREQNNAKRRHRVGKTNRGFPALVHHHQLGEHPTSTGSGDQRPKIGRIQRRERAERGDNVSFRSGAEEGNLVMPRRLSTGTSLPKQLRGPNHTSRACCQTKDSAASPTGQPPKL